MTEQHDGRRPASLGVCSWSLQPTSAADLVEKVDACGLRAVQLALGPLLDGRWDEGETVATLGDAGITVLSGMMQTIGEDYSSLDTIRVTGGLRPDAHWAANLEASRASAQLARRLGLELVTFHAGFLPEGRDDPERERLLERMRAVADAFAAEGVRVAFETGQETAGTLLQVLDDLDRPAAGVNFDPANMILYDQGEPVEALRTLADWVRQVHVKDACRTRTPGTWGREVPVGTGEVDWQKFFGVLAAAGLDCDLVIEREAGEDRGGDVATARGLVTELGKGRWR